MPVASLNTCQPAAPQSLELQVLRERGGRGVVGGGRRKSQKRYKIQYFRNGIGKMVPILMLTSSMPHVSPIYPHVSPIYAPSTPHPTPTGALRNALFRPHRRIRAIPHGPHQIPRGPRPIPHGPLRSHAPRSGPEGLLALSLIEHSFRHSEEVILR